MVCIVTKNGANMRKAVRYMQDCIPKTENACRLSRMKLVKDKTSKKDSKL